MDLMPLPLAHERGFEELVEAPRGGIVAALSERRSYHLGEGIEGGLDTRVRFGEDLEQRELHRADRDHPRSMRPPRDRSVTGFSAPYRKPRRKEEPPEEWPRCEIGRTPSPERKISAPNVAPFRRKRPAHALPRDPPRPGTSA